MKARTLFADESVVEQVGVDIDLGGTVEALFILGQLEQGGQDPCVLLLDAP